MIINLLMHWSIHTFLLIVSQDFQIEKTDEREEGRGCNLYPVLSLSHWLPPIYNYGSLGLPLRELKNTLWDKSTLYI